MAQRPLSQYYGHLGPSAGLDSSWHGVTPLDSGGSRIGIAGISVTSGLDGTIVLLNNGALKHNNMLKPFASSSPTTTTTTTTTTGSTGPRWE